MPTEDPQSITFKYLKVSQPIGDFYIASVSAKQLIQITYFDVRRVLVEQRDVERYLGVQRPLNPARVKEIGAYVTTKDACFPTGVIVAVPGRCVHLDEDACELTLSNYIDAEDESENIYFRNIARVLDGQHRLAGLEHLDDEDENFELNVSIFVDADIADQASVFSTVNLAQTKVNKSLAYDLFDLMKSRSPQKTCHNIAVTLDRDEASPFHKMIKRLGVATPGRQDETLTQATFIEPLLRLLSADAMGDRDAYLKGKRPKKLPHDKLLKHPFQHMFVDERDFEVADIMWNYFDAVRTRWPEAWRSRDRGVMLNRTNGYRALMRFLRVLFDVKFTPGTVPSTDDFLTVFNPMGLQDADFTIENYDPGSGGEGRLFRDLVEQSGLKPNG